MKIDLIAPKSVPFISLKRAYSRLLKKTLALTKFPYQVTVDILITDNHTIQKYNAQYRNKNHPTDVLSFSFLEDQSSPLKDQVPLLGQIVISYQKAKSQAKAYGHTLLREYHFLFVHGLLHLIGYNHETASDEKKMLAMQDAILGKRKSYVQRKVD